MKQSLNGRYKRRIIPVLILVIAVTIMSSLFACSGVKTENTGSFPEERYDTIAENGQVIAFSETMAFTTASLYEAKNNGQDGVHVTLIATVYPENAENQNVGWSIAWSEDSPLKSSPVGDYLTGTADQNDSRKFYATCKQAFLNNKIIITVTTEEGGFTATCTVSFIGLAESLNVTSSTANSTRTDKRGEYYAMNKDTSYTFNIAATNSWGVVGALDLEVVLGGNGELYFGDVMTDENSASTWRNVTLQSIASRIDKYASASITGNTLTITMGKYYVEDNQSQYTYKYNNGGIEWDEDHINYYVLDNFYDNGTFNWDTCETDYDTKATENFERLESIYFTATVRDKLSGVSVTIPFYFRVSVESVSVNNTTASIN